jgi:hypothetical protein
VISRRAAALKGGGSCGEARNKCPFFSNPYFFDAAVEIIVVKGSSNNLQSGLRVYGRYTNSASLIENSAIGVMISILFLYFQNKTKKERVSRLPRKGGMGKIFLKERK